MIPKLKRHCEPLKGLSGETIQLFITVFTNRLDSFALRAQNDELAEELNYLPLWGEG